MATAWDLKADRRVVKCPGCKTPSEDHHWGSLSKFCEGFEKSSPKKEMETSPTTETVFSALVAELESLELEEKELRRQEEESKLRKRITDKRKLIERLRKSGSGDAAGEDNTNRLTIKDLPMSPEGGFLRCWGQNPSWRIFGWLGRSAPIPTHGLDLAACWSVWRGPRAVISPAVEYGNVPQTHEDSEG